jgi:hypothetical protein
MTSVSHGVSVRFPAGNPEAGFWSGTKNPR